MVFVIKKYIKLLSLILVVVLFSLFAATPVSADDVLRPVITVTCPPSAIPGDTISVDVSISENPGIMAMTFTLAYDKDIFSFVSYRKGILIDYLVVDHPDKGYVSFVNCESRNRKNNGTIFAVDFTVKENAQVGTYDMKVRHIRPEEHGDSMVGCFANWKGSKILPTVYNDTINIKYTGTNCRHSFGEWITTVPAMCEDNGVRTHTCGICGHSASEEISPIGHKWQDFWTVDREATADTSGLMSRHCERCTDTTDKKTFGVVDADNNNFDNTIDKEVKPDSWDELQNILDSQQQSPSAPSVEDTTPDNDSTNSAPDTPPQEIVIPENADQLIANANVSMGLAGRIYRLFFGTQSGGGIFSLIKESAPQNLEWFFNNPLLITLAFAVIILI